MRPRRERPGRLRGLGSAQGGGCSEGFDPGVGARNGLSGERPSEVKPPCERSRVRNDSLPFPLPVSPGGWVGLGLAAA